jgi:hypothetical protein
MILKGDDFEKLHSITFNESFSLSSLSWFANKHVFLTIIALNLKSESISKRQKIYFSQSNLFSAFKCKAILEKSTKDKILDVFDQLSPMSESLQLYRLYSDTDTDNNNEKAISSLKTSENRKINI